MDQNERKVKLLFVIRVCLWIVALAATVYWIWYSIKLHLDGIFDYHTYADLLRPILYPCLIISVAAICLSFALYALSRKFKE
ncbi:MAG: hypothetical protein K6B72_02660 [Lachnospiraceae bacterium]|nr:hypothetical protein [Lachnospiraceae bacterium]